MFLGIAHGKTKDAERLLSHAEAALAQGKRQQQHCTLFDPALDAKLKRRQLIAAQLPLAIKSAGTDRRLPAHHLHPQQPAARC